MFRGPNMYCDHCGKEVPDQSSYCNFCGGMLVNSITAENQ